MESVAKIEKKDFPYLGFGLGLRPKHYPHILENKPKIDWFEIISENYMDTDGRPRRMLDRILEHYPVVMHGVSLSIGTADPIRSDYIKNLKSLIDYINPPWVSDHLCWTGVAHKNTHDLLPMPYTKQTLAHIVQRINAVQDILGRPLVLENPSTYLEFQSSTMSEWEFISRMVEETNCGLLLDVNNVYVSCYNHKWDPKTYIDSLPLHRVAQIHLAGHSNNGTHIVDTHDDYVIDEVWSLYHYVISKAGNISTMIEWDAKIPDFDVVEAELNKARYWSSKNSEPGTLPKFHKEKISATSSSVIRTDMSDEMRLMQGAILKRDSSIMNPEISIVPKPEFNPKEQLDVYINGYRYRLYDLVHNEYSALRKYLGKEKFSQLVDAYIDSIHSQHYNISYYIERFPEFISTCDLEIDSFAQELAVLETQISLIADLKEVPVLQQKDIANILEEDFIKGRLYPRKALMLFAFSHDVNNFYTDVILKKENKPEAIYHQNCFVAVYRHEDQMQRLPLEEKEYFLLSSLFGGLSIEEALESLTDNDTDYDVASIASDLQRWFSRWMNNGILSRFEI